MKMGRCCKNLWTCWENWNHTNHKEKKKKKSTSIPNDDVLKSAHVLHKCHISCQANDRVKGWPTPTRVQVHTFAYASEPILGSTQETARPFQTYLLKCVESWFSLLSFFKCHVSSLVSIFFNELPYDIEIYIWHFWERKHVLNLEIFFFVLDCLSKSVKVFLPHQSSTNQTLPFYDTSVSVLSPRSLFCTEWLVSSLFAMFLQKPVLSLKIPPCLLIFFVMSHLELLNVNPHSLLRSSRCLCPYVLVLNVITVF